MIGASTPGSVAGFVSTFVSALFISAALISRGERAGKACTSSAAAPDTMGAAPEVPPNASVPVPVPTSAETDAPGAPISGLIAS